MEDKLSRLRNTLMTIETKGESTKTMADCIRFIEKMIIEIKEFKGTEQEV